MRRKNMRAVFIFHIGERHLRKIDAGVNQSLIRHIVQNLIRVAAIMYLGNAVVYGGERGKIARLHDLFQCGGRHHLRRIVFFRQNTGVNEQNDRENEHECDRHDDL